MYDSSLPPPVMPPPPAPGLKKHSPIGIASLAVGAVSLIAVCVVFGLSLASQDTTSANYETMTTAVGIIAICAIVMSLVGVGLGIAGIVQKAQSKVFAILGLCLSALVLIGLCGIMLIGFAALGSMGL
jgi:hypothetical protein